MSDKAAKSAAQRRKIHDSIQQWGQEDEEIAGCLLVGWAVVAEWMDEDNRRWLSTVGGLGDQPLPAWYRSGYLHEVLHNADFNFSQIDFDEEENADEEED